MTNTMRKLGLALPGVAMVLLVLLIQLGDFGALRQAELLLYDSYQRTKPREPLPAPVRVIDIDDESIRRIGQWPWPRTDLARLNEALTEAGASVIAYDIVFAEPDRTSPSRINNDASARDNDAVFAEALTDSPVVAGYFLDRQASAPEALWKSGINLSGSLPTGALADFEGAIAPIDPLLDAASGAGFVTIQGDGDGIVRSAPMIAAIRNRPVASLSLEALRVAQQAGGVTLKSSDGSGETDDAEPEIVAVKAGQFEAPLTANGDLFLYFREAQPNQTIPAWKLLQGGLSAQEQTQLLEGHIVFVGAGAQGLRDLKATPLLPSDLGVNVHAQAAEQIITGQFLTRPDWALGMERFLLVALGLIMALALPFAGALRGAVLGGVLVAGVAAGSWFAFSGQQFLVNPIYPVLALTLAYLAVTGVTYYREERQRAYIHQAFDRYLSPELVKRIADDPGQLELGGEEREMTVMFCDIRSFSAISEKLIPQDIIKFLIAFLTPMTDILLARKATIDKYIGDAILAFWNAPLDDDDQYRNAARGTLEMIEELGPLNERMQAQDAEPWPGEVKIGIGMNCGPCCVGNMGSSQRLSYSLIGDTVNLASRIEGLTKQYGVQLAIGSALAEKLPDFAMLELDRVRVVGRETPETIHVLLGDEGLAAEKDFADYRATHDAMLAAYRAQDWDAAEAKLDALDIDAPALGLAKLIGIYRERIANYRADPPGADWDGVYAATSK